ncbi:MAG: S8 family serine peptidase [Chloroflexota bacterium]
MLATGLLALGSTIAPSQAFAAAPALGSAHVRPLKPAADASPSTRLIVQYTKGATRAAKASARAAAGVRKVADLHLINAEVVEPASGRLAPAMRSLNAARGVVAVEPDRRLYRLADPTAEPLFPIQWGHENTGQSDLPALPAGKADVDVDAAAALRIADGTGVLVAVVDDGVDFSHPDLAGRQWVNTAESTGTAGVDDDHDGYIDDVNGFDFCHRSGRVHLANDDFHGTAVAGTIAAAINGQGISGVAPGARIMALKFLGDDDSPTCGFTSQAIEAIQYAAAHGVHLVNASWGGPQPDPMLQAAIEAASHTLFLVAAGNDGGLLPSYPAAFPSANIVSIAAINNRGALASFSNRSRTTVDIAAPGEAIVVPTPAYSGTVGGEPITLTKGWFYFDGTSFAAPYATGIVALLTQRDPADAANPARLKARLLASGAPAPLTTSLTVTGSLANARNILDLVPPTLTSVTARTLPGSTFGVTTATVRLNWAGRDDFSLAGFTVKLKPDGGAWSTLASLTRGTSLDRTLSVGTHYTLWVRATDAGGNTATQQFGFTVKRFEESTSLATFSSGWTTTTSSTASGGHTRATSTAGRSVSVSFTGRSLALSAPVGPTRGSVRVFVDGVDRGTFSENRTTSAARRVVWSLGWNGSAAHVVKFVALGTTGHPRVDVDTFVIAN